VENGRRKATGVLAGIGRYAFRLLSFVALFVIVDLGLVLFWPFPVRILNNHNDATNFRQFDCVMPGYNNRVEQITFRFNPIARANVVSLVFNLKTGLLSDAFYVLMISAHPDIPSAWYRYQEGRVAETIFLPELAPGFRSAGFKLKFAEGQLIIYEKDRLIKIIETTPEIGLTGIGFYPSHKMGVKYLRSGVVADLKISTIEREGVKTRQAWPLWILLLLRIGLFLGLFYVMVLSRSRFSKKLLRGLTILAWVMVISFCALVVFSWATFHCGDWREPYEDEGRFNPEKLVQAQEITIKHRKLKIDRNPRLTNIMAFGGSTTMGDPYEPETKYDYPAQLQDMLNRSSDFEDHRFQVINLGNLGATLSEMLIFAEAAVASTRPTVVILHSVINNYYESCPPIMAAHILGFHTARVHVRPNDLAEYRNNLNKFISICRKYKAQPLLMEESFDKYFFDGENPLQQHQQVLRDVSREQGIPFIPLHQEMNDNPNRFIHYEWVHMSAIGYRMLADRIFTWMKANVDLVTDHTAPSDSISYITY